MCMRTAPNKSKPVKLGFTKTSRGKKVLSKTGLMLVARLAGVVGLARVAHLAWLAGVTRWPGKPW